MTKDQVLSYRDDTNQYSNGLIIVMDNMQIFSTKANHEFIIWNDEDELITCIRANVDPMTQAQSPVEVIGSTYEHIQYMCMYSNHAQAKNIVEGFKGAGLMDEETAEKANLFIDSLQNFTL